MKTIVALLASGFTAGALSVCGILQLLRPSSHLVGRSLDSTFTATTITSHEADIGLRTSHSDASSVLPTPASRNEALNIRATLDQARGIVSVSRRSKFLQDLIRKWVLIDPEKALKFASDQSSLRLRGELCQAALATMARSDRDGALQWATSHLQGDSLAKATRGILDTWSLSDPGQACAWLLKQPPSQVTESADLVIHRLVEADPNTALLLLATLPDGSIRDRIAPRFIANLSEVDPEAAATWMTQNTSPEEFGRLAQVLTQRWGYNDPEAALNWLSDNSSRTDLSNSLAAVTSYYAESNMDGALKWAKNQPDATVRQNVYSSIATTLAATEPDQAFAWFESISDPTMRQQIASSFSAGLSLNATPGRFEQLMNEPDPAVRDSLLSSFANAQVNQSSNEALTAASAIQNPQQRSVILRQVFAAVSSRAPDQATKWLASPTISEADRALLQNP